MFFRLADKLTYFARLWEAGLTDENPESIPLPKGAPSAVKINSSVSCVARQTAFVDV
jgi:hypothetical protein